MPPTLFTIGHSTHPWPDFLKILHSHNLRAIADVRRYPGSKRFPHFNADEMAHALPHAKIEYHPFKNLGGRRKALPDSPNTAWRNESFRGYADYLQTPEFAAALTELQTVAQKHPTAIMCSEAVPWRCHRSLIADALLVHGWHVLDIFDEKTIKPHALTSFATVSKDLQITYPGEDSLLWRTPESKR